MKPEFKSILVAIDFSSRRALQLAHAVAERFGSSLHLLHVVEDPVMAAAWSEAYAVDLSGLRDRLTQDAEWQLTKLASSVTGVTVTTEVRVGKPAQTIVEAVEERGCDLVVMGTHGRSGVAHLLIGSVAERVVRSARCPVLTVREASAATAAEAMPAETPHA
jgi:universal stress protein A